MVRKELSPINSLPEEKEALLSIWEHMATTSDKYDTGINELKRSSSPYGNSMAIAVSGSVGVLAVDSGDWRAGCSRVNAKEGVRCGD